MKQSFKFILAFFAAGSLFLTSCETIELEQLENPNNLNPTQSDPDLLLNSIQLAYLSNMVIFHDRAAELTRIDVFGNRDYFQGVQGAVLNTVWSRTYSVNGAGTRGMIPNTEAITELNAAAGDGSLNYQEGVAKALLAHNMMILVDFVGDVPFSEANNPLEFPAPNVDSGEEVYSSALALLDEAEALLNGQEGSDLFYDGDSEKWIKFINTVRLKAAITVGDDISDFDDDDFIDEIDDDFQYRFISQDVNPDGRHQDYATDYTPSGAGTYQSNILMNYMIEKEDPRIRYYFYRQTDCTPGASCNPDGNSETLTCSIVSAPPVHIQAAGCEDVWCYLENGYWGRAHGNDEGVPPDGFLRTTVGVYPAGGLYDDDSFQNVNLGLGGGGAGIEPFLLASQVAFWRAEAALNDGDEDDASDFLEEAMRLHITKVLSFASLDGSRDSDFDVDEDEVEDYIESIIEDFEDASGDDQWNVLAEQYLISQFGQGKEMYNFYRRTGYPTTLCPNLEANPGPFVRSFPYANDEVIANPNINQKPNQSVQVFWDNNPPSAVSGGFPEAN